MSFNFRQPRPLRMSFGCRRAWRKIQNPAIETMDFFLQALAFFYGICVGSFLNVCIYRLPEHLSIVKPRSRCPQCGTPIAFYDNIPVISFLLLAGRCRHCRARISWRYPLIETATGLCALLLVRRFGFSLPALIYFVLMAALITVTFIDIDHRIIPDVITLPGIVLGFGAAFGLPTVSAVDSLLGIAAGGGSLLAVAWIYQLVTHKNGMGGGDIKLLAMIGAFTGVAGVIFTLFVASLVGSLAGFVLVAAQKKRSLKLAVAFGPFLSLAAAIYVFAGPQLIAWYFGMLS